MIHEMNRLGQRLAGVVGWFQFIAGQFIAVVLLSTAISDEIHRRTLGTLMTSPITAGQVVLGKLAGKLLQLLLLLAVSVPLLSVIRVFGAVPWEFVTASTCITLSATLLAGAVSLYYSIHSRHAYSVILQTLLTLLIAYLVVPILVVLIDRFLGLGLGERRVSSLMAYINPFFAFLAVSEELLGSGQRTVPWLQHCVVITSLAAVELLICRRVVRRAALRQACGDHHLLGSRRKRRRQVARRAVGRVPPGAGPGPGAPSPPGSSTSRSIAPDEWNAQSFRREGIRRVAGPPVVWKELRTPWVQTRTRTKIAIAANLAMLLMVYLLMAGLDLLDTRFIHHPMLQIFLLIAVVTSAVLAATPVSSEREAGTWALLLTTPLTGTQILWGKAVGAARRCLPVWLVPAGHVVVFTLLGTFHPHLLWFAFLLFGGTLCLLVIAGIILSARFKRTTSAVLASLAVPAVLWLLGPVVASMVSAGRGDALDLALTANPFVQLSVGIEGTSLPIASGMVGKDGAGGSFSWPVAELSPAMSMALLLTLWCSVCAVALLALAIAGRKIRPRFARTGPRRAGRPDKARGPGPGGAAQPPPPPPPPAPGGRGSAR
jgi:ABC-type transport system involved in multi-copper enzyme maturation permease subunit